MLRALLLLLLSLLALPRAGAGATLAAGEPLTRSFAAPLVEAALREEAGEGERLVIEIDTPSLPLPNRAAQPAEVTLLAVRHDPAAGRFVAQLHVALRSGEASRIELAGRVRRLVEVAVPARRVERGELLTAQDLRAEWLPLSLVRDGTAAGPEELVGREARRILAAGRPVRRADLALPRLVQRGEPVTLIYEAAGLQVSTVGEALDPAAEGEPVRVLNPGSSLVRKGVAVGRRLVRMTGSKESIP